jgi:hypothetical protein
MLCLLRQLTYCWYQAGSKAAATVVYSEASSARMAVDKLIGSWIATGETENIDEYLALIGKSFNKFYNFEPSLKIYII